LALAFDCNLATFGFPYGKELDTPAEIAAWISTTTSIGESGGYLVELAGRGRFSAFDFPKKGFPPQLGEVVVTTRKPEVPKKVSAADIRSLVASGKSILLVFGLGPRGLPSNIFDMSSRHLDVTGRGFSLETCTALGAVVALLRG
jgi:hypothetical protein